MKEEKRFKPDFKKPRFKVVIEVFENCQTINLEREKDSPTTTYQELIGVLETAKMCVFVDQSTLSIEEMLRLKKEGKFPKQEQEVNERLKQ